MISNRDNIEKKMGVPVSCKNWLEGVLPTEQSDDVVELLYEPAP